MLSFNPEENSLNAEKIISECKLESHNNVVKGKVRDVLFLNNHRLVLFEHSDRLSSYDSNICNVNGKGILLNYMSSWWMNMTKHIIPNHYIYHSGRYQLARKCKRIDIEVIVRGYITGSSSTSLWTLYKDNKHDVYSITLPKGLVKNQRLDSPVVTPTTKDEHDEPLRDEQIIEKGLLREDQWNYIKRKAVELYNYGSIISESKGLILVDTKYEFGIDEVTGEIMLIDEIHTCDSSRYWNLSSYQERFNNKQEPENFDKDHIRRYLLEVNPEFKNQPLHERIIPDIPLELKEKVYQSYYDVFNMLTSIDLNTELNNVSMESFLDTYINNLSPLVVVLSGSVSDIEKVKKVNSELDKHGIIYHNYFHSAHKETLLVMNLIEQYNALHGKRKLVFITVVGMSNALGGVLAANTKFPVLNCPNFKDSTDMMVNVNSSLQMPSRVPSAVVLRPDNVALLARNILNL